MPERSLEHETPALARLIKRYVYCNISYKFHDTFYLYCIWHTFTFGRGHNELRVTTTTQYVYMVQFVQQPEYEYKYKCEAATVRHATVHNSDVYFKIKRTIRNDEVEINHSSLLNHLYLVSLLKSYRHMMSPSQTDKSHRTNYETDRMQLEVTSPDIITKMFVSFVHITTIVSISFSVGNTMYSCLSVRWF